MQGCISRVEGCLDVAAANFDLNADKSCNDCCSYPMLSLGLSQKWDDRNFSTSDTFTISDRNGLLYRINDLKYLLSSWSWKDASDNIYSVDSAELTCLTGQLRYTPDVLLIDSKQFQYVLGTIRKSPVIDTVLFKLGVIPSFDCLDPVAINTPSILSANSVIWDVSTSSRATVRLILQRDITQDIHDTLFIHITKDLKTGYDLDFVPGISTEIKISVNYAKWFTNVDILDLETFRNSLEEGIEGSFYKTP